MTASDGRGPTPSSSGKREISLSIEETNRLRAQIGLKPLRTSPAEAGGDRKPGGSASQPVHAPPPKPSVQSGDGKSNVEARVPKVSSIASAAILGVDDNEELDDTEDTAAWVARMRRDSVGSKKVSKRPRPGSSRHVDASNQGNDASASGARVQYGGIDSMAVEEEVVLTLADSNVLDESGNVLNENVDVLVSVLDRENAKAREAVRLQSGAAVKELEYDPTDDHEFAAGASTSEKRAVLAKYDDRNEDSFRTVGEDGALAEADEEERKRVSERLRAAREADTTEEMGMATTFESDFYSKEEYSAKFKKRGAGHKRKEGKKKKRKGKDKKSVSKDSVTGARSENNTLGEDKKLSSDQSDEDEELRLTTLKALREAAAAEERRKDREEEEEDENAELYESLARARRLATQARSMKAAPVGPEKVLETVKASLGADVVSNPIPAGGDKKSVPVILTEAEQFVRTIGQTSLYVDGAEDVEDGLDESGGVDVSEEISIENLEAGKRDSGPSKTERLSVSEDAEPANPLALEGFSETDGVVPQPMGLAQTLARLRTLGQLDNQQREQSGRVRDERVDLNARGGGKDVKLSYKDDQGRDVTPKEAFRIMSHKFHGKGPGQNKREALMRRRMQNMDLRRKAQAEDTPLASVAALVEETRKTQSAHVVLSGAAAIPQIRRERQEPGALGDSLRNGNSGEGQPSNDVDTGDDAGQKSSPSGKKTLSESKVEFSLGNAHGPPTKRTRRV